MSLFLWILYIYSTFIKYSVSLTMYLIHLLDIHLIFCFPFSVYYTSTIRFLFLFMLYFLIDISVNDLSILFYIPYSRPLVVQYIFRLSLSMSLMLLIDIPPLSLLVSFNTSYNFVVYYIFKYNCKLKSFPHNGVGYRP